MYSERMTPAATNETRIETSRWSLGLAIGLLLASVTAVGALVPRLSPHSPYKEAAAKPRPAAIPRAADPDVPPILPATSVPEAELRGGLLAEYFRLEEAPPEFPAAGSLPPPALVRVDRQINFERTSGGFALTELRDRFAVRWTGLLRIPRDGRTRFFLASVDGSRLFIDDLLVVDNGGVHEMREASGEITLRSGDHEFRLELFDHSGPAGCTLSWEADGLLKDVIPEKAYFHRRGDEKN